MANLQEERPAIRVGDARGASVGPIFLRIYMLSMDGAAKGSEAIR
jgi:hypothetical protein